MHGLFPPGMADAGRGGGGGSLGACGDAVGLNFLTVYALALAQLPAMFLVTLNFPPVKLDFFATSVKTVVSGDFPAVRNGSMVLLFNGTAVNLQDPTQLHYMHSLSISFAFIAVSGLCTVFVVMTLYLRERGVADGVGGAMRSDVQHEEYVTSNVELVTDPTVTMWGNVFMGIVVKGHVLLAAVVDSPTSVHFLLLIGLLMYMSLAPLLGPRIHCPDTDASSRVASTASSTYLFSLGGYCLAMGYIASNIPVDPHSAKLQLVVLVGFLDMFLLIFGHTWDPVPLMQTIINCRLVYASLWIAINLGTYVLWTPFMRVQFVSLGKP